MADTNLLAVIGWQSFEEAFGAANTPENMASFLATTFTPEIIAQELAEPAHQFYIAETEGQVAGYIKLNCPSPDKRVPYEPVLKICRLYLLREYMGFGFGDQLMQFSLEKAKLLGCRAVWLTVWEHNPRAISFYHKWGFTQVSTDDFILGEDVQLDYLMVKAL